MLHLIVTVLQIYLLFLFGRDLRQLGGLWATAPRMGGMALDLSPTVLILAIFVLIGFLG